MREQIGWHGQTGSPSFSDRFAQFHRVPIDDDRREQVQPSDAVMLTFPGAVSNLTVTVETKRSFQGMVCFTFIETDLSAALHVCIQYPVDDEQGPLDAADFAHGQGQLILPGI